MKLLLDESLPRRLADRFVGHQVSTVPGEGWAGLENAALLARAAQQFDLFVTADQNLPHQLDLGRYDIAVLVLGGPSHRLADLRPLADKALRLLDSIPAGSALTVAA